MKKVKFVEQNKGIKAFENKLSKLLNDGWEIKFMGTSYASLGNMTAGSFFAVILKEVEK